MISATGREMSTRVEKNSLNSNYNMNDDRKMKSIRIFLYIEGMKRKKESNRTEKKKWAQPETWR